MLTPEELEQVVVNFQLEYLDGLDRRRKRLPLTEYQERLIPCDVFRPTTLEEAHDLAAMAHDEAELKEQAASLDGRGEFNPYFYRIMEIVENHHHLQLEPEERAALRVALLEACSVIDRVGAERSAGKASTDLQLRVMADLRARRKDPGIKLSELFRQYIESKEGQVKADTFASIKRDCKYVLRSVGDVGVKTITVEKARAIRDDLVNSHAYSGSKVGKSIKSVDKKRKPRTIAKRIIFLSGIFDFGKEGGLVDMNPFKRLHPKDTRQPSEKTREFTHAELQLLFDAVADRFDPITRPEMLFLPLFGPYMGTRPNEAAMLHLEDIKSEDGIDYVELLNDAEKGKSVKQPSSTRKVPVPTILKDLGFLRYVDSQRRKGSTRLYDNLAVKTSGRVYDPLSPEFNGLVDECVSDDPLLRFYDLRKTFVNALEHKYAGAALEALDGNQPELFRGLSGFEEFIQRAMNDLTGHAQEGTRSIVYRKAELKIKSRLIEHVEYPVDLSKIRAKLAVWD
jgi:integrase